MGDDFGHADESREESGRRGNTWVDIAPVCAIQRAAGGGKGTRPGAARFAWSSQKPWMDRTGARRSRKSASEPA
jgi:hypothetical protein